MNLREAINKKYLRVVPLTEKGFLTPYNDTPWLGIKEAQNTRVALVNIQNKFLFLKDKRLFEKTLTSSTGTSLVFIDDNASFKPENKPKKSMYIRVDLTEELLKTNFTTASKVQDIITPFTFSQIAKKVIQKQELTKEELVSLFLDKRSRYVFEMESLVSLTKEPVLIEIVTASSERSRLLLQEIEDDSALLSLDLFDFKDLKKAKKLE